MLKSIGMVCLRSSPDVVTLTRDGERRTKMFSRMLSMVSVLVFTAFVLVWTSVASADDSLLVYLPFDDKGDVAKDATGEGNEGQFVVVGGGKVQWVDGKFDGGIELDGQSYVDIPWSDSIDVADGSFTAEIWFNYTEASSAGSLAWCYNLGNVGTPAVWIRTEPANNRIRGAINSHAGWGIIATTSSYNDGEWHHLAFVRDNSKGTMTFYIDGEVDVSAGIKAASVTEDHVIGIYLGQKINGTDRYKGILDEFRLWKRALSQDEIKANMSKSKDQVLAVQLTARLIASWGSVKAKY